MPKVTVVSTELPIVREIGAQSRLVVAKKTELRIGWDGASQPEVLAQLAAYDEREVNAVAAALMARFSQ